MFVCLNLCWFSDELIVVVVVDDDDSYLLMMISVAGPLLFICWIMIVI